MNSKCVIVIPMHRKPSLDFEIKSIFNLIEKLGNKYDIFILCKKSNGDNILSYIKDYFEYEFKLKKYDDYFLDGWDDYSDFCEDELFYEPFKDYEYILIHQMDAWINYDNLDYFCNLGYDYYGAPHFVYVGENQHKLCVGNGGLTLRKVSSIINICKNNKDNIHYKGIKKPESKVGEDVFFSYIMKDKLNVCPIDIAIEFCCQQNTEVSKVYDNKKPFGYHWINVGMLPNVTWNDDSKNDTNLDIFICTNNLKKFNITNYAYHIINDLYCETFNNGGIEYHYEKDVPEVSNMQRSYGECSRMYWVWKKYDNFKDYIGFCHYRRFFNFYEDIPNIKKLFKHYDAIVAKEPWYTGKTIESHFDNFLDVRFLKLWLDVINKVHPEYTKKEINGYLKRNIVCMRNMYILKKEDFYKYMEWCFSIAEEYNRIYNLKTQDDVTRHCREKCAEFGIEYKGHYDRLHGYYFEACQGLYFLHNFKRILGLPIKQTE